MESCWDVMKCGERRETCPAYPTQGRNCFAVTGTMCRGEEQGSYEEKIAKCRACEFYKKVMGLG
jgi:methyl-accepting chemotaxis protein